MSSVEDLVASLGINSVTSVAFICAYAFLKNQPLNARVYFTKWLMRGQNVGPQPKETPVLPAAGRYFNFDIRTYFHAMDWIKTSLRMPEAELIEHAGLDSVVYLRMILLGMRIFLPMMVYSFVVLVPVNVTDKGLTLMQRDDDDFTYSSLDTITISNVRNKSGRLWAHLLAAYMYTIWTCWLLFHAYRSIVNMRFDFLEEQDKRPDQFTVLCRCIPENPEKSVKEQVEEFFRVNHPDYYLFNEVVYNTSTLSALVQQKEKLENKVAYWKSVFAKAPSKSRRTKKGCCGLWGKSVDRMDFYIEKINHLTNEIRKERTKVLQDESYVLPAAFVSFQNRWAAAVCAQTKQSKDSAKWLTKWAPEPRDVYWKNLPIPHLQLRSRMLISSVVLFFMIFFFLIPVTFVQSLANLDKLERNIPFLKPLIEVGFIKSVLQGYLPGLSLKIFLRALPFILLWLSIFEGHESYSQIERQSAVKYLVFMLINVFLGNVVTGSTFEQLKLFIQKPTKIPSVLGKAIPMRATFFITYIMVDGWTHCANDLARSISLVFYHIQNTTMVRTARDRDKATPVSSVRYTTAIPRLGLYFLLGFVYSIISPLILPFILIYLAAAYVVYRNQMINVYEQKYESAGSYWPMMFAYIILGLLVMHATLIGLMALKEATISTPFLLPLPICTILFWRYCNSRFGDAFRFYALEEARAKDIIEREREPNLDHRDFLEGAYMNPILKKSLQIVDGEIALTDSDDVDGEEVVDQREGSSHPTSKESNTIKGSMIPKEQLLETKVLQEDNHELEVIGSTNEGIEDTDEVSCSSIDKNLLGHQGP